MPIIVELPDALESLLLVEGIDPTRAVLEAIVLEGYRSGRVSEIGLQLILGFDSSAKVTEFLIKHGVLRESSAQLRERDFDPAQATLSVADLRKPEGRKSLPELFAESPFAGLNIEFDESDSQKDFGRDIEL